MLELRILSGYHRGATLPLGDEVLSIGGDEDADVVLADPGLAPRHAQLAPQGAGWALEAVDGVVRDDQDNGARDAVFLDGGGFARVGPIWLTVCAAASPWQDPPAEPTGPLDDEEAGPMLADEEDMPQDALPEPEPEPAPPEPSPAPALPPPVRSRGARTILVPLTAVAVLSAAAAYAWTGRPDGSAAVPGRVAAVAPPQQLAAAQLQAALRKRLGEIDLLARVTLDLRTDAWTISGALNDDETARLQRMLRTFSERYVVDIPVNVTIGSPEAMLPFRISQVIASSDPSIVLDDGRRLYVGDEYRGVRLAAIAGSRLRFTGRHNLDIAW